MECDRDLPGQQPAHRGHIQRDRDEQGGALRAEHVPAAQQTPRPQSAHQCGVAVAAAHGLAAQFVR